MGPADGDFPLAVSRSLIPGTNFSQQLSRCLGQRQTPIVKHEVLPSPGNAAGEMIVIRVLVRMQSHHVDNGRRDAGNNSPNAGGGGELAVMAKTVGEMRAGQSGQRRERRQHEDEVADTVIHPRPGRKGDQQRQNYSSTVERRAARRPVPRVLRSAIFTMTKIAPAVPQSPSANSSSGT